MASSRPLRVLIDGRMLIGSFAGVARVVTRLVDELASQPDLQVAVLGGDEPYAPWAGRSDIEWHASGFARRHRRAGARAWWEERHLPKLIRAARADVWHATWNTGIPLRCPVPAVLTLHDLIPLHEPHAHFATLVDRWAHAYALRAALVRASTVATVSAYVRQDVLQRLGLSAGKVQVIANGVDLPAADLDTSPARQPPYVLYVGGHEPRKNVAGVLRAMSAYWHQHGLDLALHLTGEAARLCGDARQALSECPAGAPVRFLGTCSDAELQSAYCGAVALLLLSRDEGFGLPALEAMAHGCPVVAANRASLPEVVGEAGLLVEPGLPAQAALAIHRLRTDADLRAQLQQAGRARAPAFTWQAAADRWRAVYEHAACCSPARTTPKLGADTIPHPV